MRCKDDYMVADWNNFTKSTFSILCGGDEASPAFDTPLTADDWPRCIPKACVEVYEEHKQNDTGVCRCEFTECSEYVFSGIDDQCPDWPGGPICGMSSYVDDFDTIGALFDEAPEVSTNSNILLLEPIRG